MSATAITVIEREKVAQINREHGLVVGAYGQAVEHAVNCGRMLAAVKADLRHGEWLPWLQENFDGNERTAQLYMQLAAAPELEDPKRVSDLSLRVAIKHVQSPRQMSTCDVAGLLGQMGHGEGRERQVREAPEREELWTGAQERKRERVLDSLEVLREKLDRAVGPGLSAFSISEILKSAALEARAAASRLDELAFSFER